MVKLLAVVGFLAASALLLWVTFMLAQIPTDWWWVGVPA